MPQIKKAQAESNRIKTQKRLHYNKEERNSLITWEEKERIAESGTEWQVGKQSI